MAREVPRTLLSLSPPVQRNVRADDYEILIVDNGSSEPMSLDALEPLGKNVQLLSMEEAPPSPAAAVNRGLAAARGEFLGVVLDGARMFTPGVVHHALLGLRLSERAIVATMAWHLGPDHQSRSVRQGYDRVVEDALLESISWPDDGYRLFEIGALALSNPGGWFGPLAESCGLFMPRSLFDELGGYDERFDLPGGGFLNLDTFVRACELPSTRLVVLLGEGSFHQLHGGSSSNSSVDRGPEFHEQYVRLRNKPFSLPGNDRTYLGTLPPGAARFVL